MNKLSLTMSVIAAVGVALPFLSQPAMAQNQSRIKDGDLPPVQFYRSRLKVRVENRTPIVTYDTPPPQEPIYAIPTGLPQATGAPVVVLPGPGQAGGTGGGNAGGTAVPPGYALVDPNHPAPARFGSNIPAQGMAPASARALPQGTTTNRLAGKMFGPPKSSGASVASPVRRLPAGDAVAKTATYQPTPSSGTGSGSAVSTVKTTTHAVLAPRGSLLK